MICVHCQRENRPGAKFCKQCAAALDAICPSCGSELPPAAKFCDECGASVRIPQPRPEATTVSVAVHSPADYTPKHLAEKILQSRSALDGERKQVTVVFCDIANSTPLAHQLGDEVMHDLLNDFFALALGEVHRLEGTINQFLGDGFMALFGAPLAHEDHVRRALLAVQGIRHKLNLAAAGKRAALSHIQLRMGLNTGTVVVGKIGDNLRMDYTAVGDTTNIAARLQGVAAPGQICVSESIYEVGRAYFDFSALGKRALKGVQHEVEVFELTNSRARRSGNAAQKGLRIGSALVGREQELAVLQGVVTRLAGGKGGILILTGEPGTGKSRLVAELRRQRSTSHLAWLEGRAVSFGRSLSYLPFIEIVKQCFAISEDDSEDESWGKLERGIADLFGARAPEIVPYLATMLALRLPAEYEERVKYLNSQGLGGQVFSCMRQLFERLAHRGPVVVELEDWHWADQSSIELAEHLLPLTSVAPLLALFTTRPDPGSAMARIRQFAAEQHQEILHEVQLTTLNDEHSETLIGNLVGTLELPLAMRELILRKTEGNPFFIEEVIRTLVTDGILVRNLRDQSLQLVLQVSEVSIPDTVQGLILARIDRLQEDAKHVLKLASVIGRSFFDRVLKAIDETRCDLDSNLAELEQSELIRRRPSAPEIEYIFKHALVHEATYGSILVDNRRAIHRRVAHAIEMLFVNRLDEFTSVLAYHFSCAEVWDKAQEYLFKAGDQAGRMAADTEALEHFREAEAAYLKAFGDKLSPLQRASLARKIGSALYGTGHYESALEQFRRALSQLGMGYPTSRWGIRGAIVHYLGAHFIRRLNRRMGRHMDRGIELESAQELSRVCHSMSWMDYFIDKERMLLDCLMELHVGENSLDTVAQAQGMSSLAFSFMTFNLRGLSRRYHGEAIMLAERTSHPAAIAFASFALGFLDFYDGRWDEADANFAYATMTYRVAGDMHRAGGAVLMRSFICDLRGDIPQLMAMASGSASDGEDSADPQLSSWAYQIRGYAELASGPLEQAVANLRKGVAIAAKIPAWDNFNYQMSLLGKCLVLQGKLDEAQAVFDEAMRIMKVENLYLPFDQIEVFTGLATCHLALVESKVGASRTRKLREAARSCAKALALARRQPAWLAQALRLHGTLDWLAGRQAAAHRHWQASLTMAESSGFVLERARTLLEIGRLTHTSDPVEQAVGVFRQAGANVGLALALHVQADLQSRAGGDPNIALQIYASAIAALEAVNIDGHAALAREHQARLRRCLEQSVVAHSRQQTLASSLTETGPSP